MKKQIIGWAVFAGLLLVIGIGIYKSVREKSDAVGPESTRESVQPELRGGVISSVSEKLIPVSSVESSDLEWFDAAAGFTVLDERQNITANGDVERKRLVKREGKYPNRILIETLRRDRQQNKFVPAGRIEMAADHILVNLREGQDVDALTDLNATHGATIIQQLSGTSTFVVQLESTTLDALETAIKFYSEAADKVAYAEPDYVRYPTALPNDTDYGQLWGMTKISAPAAWDISTGNSNVVVAVIDSGMDMDHPDLLSNLWSNDGEIAGDGIDNDNNGYIDDVNGWNFVANSKDPEDDQSHGTHCAGTIGAVGNNGNQVVGICWNVSIMPLKSANAAGSFVSDTSVAIRYAVDNGAKVLSNSYGGGGNSQTDYDAILYAHNKGAIFVAAAGNDAADNDAIPMYPAGYDVPNVISVAATDSSDDLAGFSNFGATSVDLAAPGVGILSTVPDGATELKNGTSMACPHVAGAMALLLGVQPDLAPAEAKQILMNSIDPVVGLAGKVVTGGRLNLQKLMAGATDSDGDDMPDEWETLYGFNPLDASDGGTNDFDGDFLFNTDEYLNNCNPTNSDTDADSLVDGWEVTYGFNPLNVAGPLSKLQYLGANSDCKDAYAVDIQSNLAFVADGSYGLKILDITEPSNVELVGTFATQGSARGIEVADGYAYLSDAEKGFFIIDVSNPANPVQAGVVQTNAYNAALDGTHAYVAGGTNGMFVIDISTPASPSIVGSYNTPYITVNDLTVVGSKVYLAMDNKFGRLTISDPANPSSYYAVALADTSGPSIGEAIHYDGTHFYLTLKDFGYSEFNLSMTRVSRYEHAAAAKDIDVFENFVFMADGAEGLLIVDNTDLNDLKVHARYKSIIAQGVKQSGGYVYVAGLGSGFHSFIAGEDVDSDGLYDKWEMDNFGSLSQTADTDFDSDGIINWGEYLANLDPADDDQDSDSLIDGFDEVQTYNTDPRTDDTDTDGLTDSFEVTTNAIDNMYLTNPLLADTDDDGMTDKWELDNGLNPLIDDGGLDSDNDGATNRDEEAAGTDPQSWDTDFDGMPDGWEIESGLDPLVDDAALNPDGDMFTNLTAFVNLQEYLQISNNAPYFASTNPNKADSDDDGLSDTEEIELYLTDPNNADTDADGMPDGWETEHGLDPFSDDSTLDSDGDGLSNYEEYLNGSSPSSADTDADGFTDDWERDWGTSATNTADPLVVDDDHPDDPQPQYPLESNTNENGSAQAPFDAIQEAINVATNGPVTILVMEGLYDGPGNFDIDPQGKELIIRSHGGATNTLITSYGIGAGFIFRTGETTNTILRGFSITTTLNACSDGNCDQRHGIVCNAASPLIRDCIIYECELRGISCTFGASPVISNCVVSTCLYGIYAEGGATPIILESTVALSGNHAELEDSGLGITALDSSGLVVSNCTVYGTSGRGIKIRNDAAAQISDTLIQNNLGGVSLDASSPVFRRCEILGNIAPDYITINGTRVLSSVNEAEKCAALDDWVDIIDEDENGGAVLSMRSSFPYFENCLIATNKTVATDPAYPNNSSIPNYGLGGGIYVGADCEAYVMNCTLADNSAFTRGGGFSNIGGGINGLFNSVVWGNTAYNHYLMESQTLSEPSTNKSSTYPSLHCRSGSISTSFSDVEYGYAGSKNIDADPLFVGGADYRFSVGSPCIDTGGIAFQTEPSSPVLYAPTHDADGLGRPLDGNGDGDEDMDMGAYEFINPASDTDGDDMPDYWERIHGFDLLMDDSSLDPDSDGLSNLEEFQQLAGVYGQSTNPHDSDSDDDDLLDGEEVNIHGTNPNVADTDGDLLSDKWEVDNGLDPLVSSGVADDDADGLSNFDESQLGTDPNNDDTDGDGMSDGWEVLHALNPLVNDAANDPDADTLNNLAEFNQRDIGPYFGSTNPNLADTDADGLSDADEINLHGTDPNHPDTDGDGMSDKWELVNGLNPLVDDASIDSDGDSLSNYDEFLNGSSPDLADTDADGYADDLEFQWGTQSTNAADPILVDDDHSDDPAIYDPTFSNPNEDGTKNSPFDAIQEAIDAAQDGMLVLVTNGYYIGTGNMNIDTKGKAIRVFSYNGYADTFIDADGLGAGFVFSSGEGSNTVISGFTISSPPGDCSDGTCGYEHGVICSDGSSPVIEDCYIFGCALNGIQCYEGSSPIVRSVEIDGCSVGIAASDGSTPVIESVSISDCAKGIQSSDSVGLKIKDSTIANCAGRGLLITNDPELEIMRTRVADNLGGMTLKKCKATIDRCMIEDNIAPDYASDGKYSYNIALQAVRSEGSMSDMTDEDENGAGIMLLNGSVLYLQNSLLAGNNAVALDPGYPSTKTRPDYGLGGGLYIGSNCFATNMNCTYANNEARRGGGISSHGSHTDYIRNTVLWDNETQDKWIESTSYTTTSWVPGNIEGGVTNMVPEVTTHTIYRMEVVVNPIYSSLHCRDGAFNVWYCDVENGESYISVYKRVIEADPLFSTNFSLSAGSPCIDEGTPFLAPLYDFGGISRPLNGDNNGTSRHDMGAFEAVHAAADSDNDGVLDQDEIDGGTNPTKDDTDADGMLDGYEVMYGFDATSDDASADADGDGLSNLAESGNGTDPTKEDTDGDNSSDGDEMIAGTSATDPSSYFYVSNIQPLVGGGCDIVFDTVVGRTYTVYCCTELGGEWNLVLGNIPGDGNPAVINDPDSSGSCFYKVDVYK